MGKKGPRGRNFTPDERAIMLKVALAGGSIIDLNSELKSFQVQEGLPERQTTEASLSMIKNAYLSFVQSDDAAKEHIFRPSTLGKLKIKASLQKKDINA
jgi:hypothetical protein